MILTIGRQLGAGGVAVGQRVAELTGMKLFDRELLDAAAEQSGIAKEYFSRVDEQTRHGISSGLFGMRFPFTADHSTFTASALSNDRLFLLQSETIAGLADKYSAQGTIFVGRCANFILRDRADMRSVFLTASTDDRIARIMDREHCSAEQAKLLIERVNKERAAYYDYYTSRTWGKASSYHACLNTSVLGMETTVDIILQILGAKRAK